MGQTKFSVGNWGPYLGPEALSKGVDVCVSTWTRIAPKILPAMSKAAANYHELAIHPHGSRGQWLSILQMSARRWASIFPN
jgi:hypothetical protein